MMQLLYCAKYAWYRGTEVLFNTRYHANSLEHIVPHMGKGGREGLRREEVTKRERGEVE